MGMCSANGRRRYIVTSSLIGWARTQNDPCILCGRTVMCVSIWSSAGQMAALGDICWLDRMGLWGDLAVGIWHQIQYTWLPHDMEMLSTWLALCEENQVIFKVISVVDGWGIFLTDDKSTLLQVMTWCRQATSHYLNQCWRRYLTPYDVTRPWWVNVNLLYFLNHKAAS